MKKTVAMVAGAAVLSLGLMGNAAADGAALYKSKTCFSCHGADAKTPIMPIYPKLAGQSTDYAFNQMMDIKSGKRANGQSAAMKAVMGMVSKDEAKEIAQWLSEQK
ncbi:MAG: c-type cytochrome [Gammaproteobacteria bacterium]|nr:c-type cytochrome [Gammaproteobacteria bacterium]